jgi:phosphodiesterase/alkaline phosphatase D-like protein
LTVVGHCTSTSAHILCGADGVGGDIARLAWRANGESGVVEMVLGAAPPYELGVLNLVGLPPGAEVTYAIAIAPNADALPGADRILESGARRFRLLPPDRPPRVALLSCNGVFEIEDERRRYDMWKRLAAEIADGKVDLVIHAGDQVYADDIVKRHATAARDTKDPEAMLRLVTEEYRRLYIERFWTQPDVAAVLTSCPNVMTWDDHDIDEGWGSNPNDDQPYRRLFFRAAQQAFAEFQASIGCGRIDEDSFACGFVHGDVGFLLLDGRSHRLYKKGRVLGEAQFNAARRWLDALPQTTRRVYLVLGIPPVHAKLSTAAAILRWTPFSEPYASDLRDGWASKGNRRECARLMQLLLDFYATHPATDITILSGDVHVGDIGKLEHPEAGVTWQVTSSGIGSPPPDGLSGWLMEKVSRPAIDLGAGFCGTLIPITEHGHDLMNRRNFALLDLEESGLRVRLFGEGLPGPREFLLPSRAARRA